VVPFLFFDEAEWSLLLEEEETALAAGAVAEGEVITAAATSFEEARVDGVSFASEDGEKAGGTEGLVDTIVAPPASICCCACWTARDHKEDGCCLGAISTRRAYSRSAMFCSSSDMSSLLQEDEEQAFKWAGVSSGGMVASGWRPGWFALPPLFRDMANYRYL